MHTDGYVQLRDRAKDIVISGGENISTIEVEHAILTHPSVLEAAVVGTPDDKWGERPKAFVVIKNEKQVAEAELIAHVKSRIASYKAPSIIEFVLALPRTSTGKVRKNELREAEWAGHATRIKGSRGPVVTIARVVGTSTRAMPVTYSITRRREENIE